MAQLSSGRTGKRSKLVLAGVMTIGLWFSSATAQAGFIDQRNDAFDPNLFNSIRFLAPIGQEFVPAFSSLNFVDLFTQDFDDTEHAGALLSVNIRFSTITGPILGTSLPVSLPDGFNGITHFVFPADVPLLSGGLHVIEAVVVAGDNWAVGRTDKSPDDTYPAGRPITLGEPEPDGTADLWFREGIAVPEPSTFILLSIGSLALTSLWRPLKSWGLTPQQRGTTGTIAGIHRRAGHWVFRSEQRGPSQPLNR